MIHYFNNDIHSIPIPDQFTFPFHYTPHPLCILASGEVQAYLQSRPEWHSELQQGKMFGVLTVRTDEGRIGYLAAFSGNLAGSNHHTFFVPPIYDLLNPEGYFKEEEENIYRINRKIADIENKERFIPEKIFEYVGKSDIVRGVVYPFPCAEHYGDHENKRKHTVHANRRGRSDLSLDRRIDSRGYGRKSRRHTT